MYQIKMFLSIQGNPKNYFCETLICKMLAFWHKTSFYIFEYFSITLFRTYLVIEFVVFSSKSSSEKHKGVCYEHASCVVEFNRID